MAREILSISEEKLSEVIAVIRQGLKHLTDVSDETRKQLTEWCNKEELSKKHSFIIKFLQERNDIIDWDDKDLTPEIIGMIHDAIPDVVRSYCETETYMLNFDFEGE